MSHADKLVVLAASYGSVADAEIDFLSIQSVVDGNSMSHVLDVALVDHEEGRLRLLREHKEPPNRATVESLATLIASAIMRGLSLVGGLAGGADARVTGAITTGVSGGLTDDEIQQVGDVLAKGQGGLVAVCCTDLADPVAASIKSADRYVSGQIDANPEKLARQLKEAEAGG